MTSREPPVAVRPATSLPARLLPNADTAGHDPGYRLLFEANPRPMWVHDLDTLQFLDVNPAALARYGYTREQFLALTALDVRPSEDVGRLLRYLEDVGGKAPEEDHVWRHVKKNGEVMMVNIASAPVTFAGRRARLVLADDITEELAMEQTLIQKALHDPLTGLANRVLFVDRLDHALACLSRAGTTIAVLFIDLDRFKAVNDSLGHGVGDEVLKSVAQRLQSIVRPGDTAARFGGDEFAVLSEGMADGAEGCEVANRIFAALAEPVAVEGGRIVTTGASIGVALASASEGRITAEALLRDADAAMYEAKKAGRNRFMIFDNESRRKTAARAQRAEELRDGLDRGELRVFYQPVVDLNDEACVGVEALVRWEHPERGLMAPGDFIGVAEETGTVGALGAWVLAEACREVSGRPALSTRAPLEVAVNLSARQLTQASLIDVLWRSLDETGLSPSRLCLEITESVLMEDMEVSLEALLGLRSLGVRIAVDDFGTGYSSLSYLRRLPVDIVKIDRSFVGGVGVNPADDAIVAAVINLSHALGLRVIAEGVETEQQLIAVRALGCDQGQGFYWSKPLPPADLGAWEGQFGGSSISAEPVDLYGLLVDRTAALRNATGRPIVLQAPQRLGSAVAELAAVRTILDHLLGNAVTYSGTNRPIVVSAASDRRWVRVSVADFGVGMSAHDCERCFEQFWQAPDLEPHRGTGTGIGLYIVRSLVEAMGGHVGVKSVKGKGSTFTFALPRSARAAARPARALGPGVSEDSTIREFMRQIGVPTRRGS